MLGTGCSIQQKEGCLENEDLRPKNQKRRPLVNDDPLENKDLENEDPLEKGSPPRDQRPPRKRRPPRQRIEFINS